MPDMFAAFTANLSTDDRLVNDAPVEISDLTDRPFIDLYSDSRVPDEVPVELMDDDRIMDDVPVNLHSDFQVTDQDLIAQRGYYVTKYDTPLVTQTNKPSQ